MNRMPVPFLFAIAAGAVTFWKSGMGPSAYVLTPIAAAVAFALTVFPRHPKPRSAPRDGKDWPVTAPPVIAADFEPASQAEPFTAGFQTSGDGSAPVNLTKEPS